MRFPFFSICLTGLMIASPLTGEVAMELRQLMGERAYTAAGISKLSDSEQAALLAWLQGRDMDEAGDLSPAPKEDSAGAAAPGDRHIASDPEIEQRIEEEVERRLQEEKEQAEQERKERGLELFGFLKPDPDLQISIEARIQGKFIGWSGKTHFTLQNGQVWRQRSSGKYYYPMTDPEVTIVKETMGYWLTVNKTGARVAVERIK